MKSTLKLGQKALFLVLSVLFLAVTVSCAPEAKPQDIDLLPAVDGVPAEFRGTWEHFYPDTGYGEYTERYIITASTITSNTPCIYNVVSTTPVTGSNGETIILCQTKLGTSSTPRGNFYAIYLKMNGTELDISCPLDYNSVYTTLEELKAAYMTGHDSGINSSNRTSTVNKQ